MTEISNPFRPTRWEHHRDGRPLIWFTATAEELAGEKSVYVYGSRGSGKTTLLKGISWEELCYNESLKLQRKLADFSQIGIYVRFPDHISASMSFSGWEELYPQALSPEFEYHRFFSLAVELICAERALDACHSLRLLSALAYQPSQELRLVEDFCSEYPELGAMVVARPKTFVDLARLLRVAVRRMNEACGRGTVAELTQTLPAREPYQLLSYLLERLGEAIRLQTQIGERAVGFKFCLDDCEVLSPLQRKSLNSLVRLTRSPISWVISSVGTVHDDSDTFIESQPLTDADRRVISLDGRDKEDFRSLCQAVVSLRLLFSLPPDERPAIEPQEVGKFFDLEQRLGTRDVNAIFAQAIKRSNRPLGVFIQQASERFYRAIRKVEPRSAKKFDPKEGRLPYYETYVLLHWRGREDAFSAQFNPADITRLDDYAAQYSDPAFNAWLRRKQQAALLHFAAKLRVKKLPLAGSNIIVTLADGSIRDFLEIMGEIYEAYAKSHNLDKSRSSDLAKFATSRTAIAATIQTAGIYAASSAYVAGISQRSDADSDIVSRLVHGLGYYTSFLQSNPADARPLAVAERGVFLIDFPASDDIGIDLQTVAAALRQAELAGYLRTVETPRSVRAQTVGGASRALAFRLHRRFAPHFRFSSRGAYEPVRLNSQDLSKLCLGADEGSPFGWAKDMAGMAEKFGSSQITLPLSEISE